MAKKLSKTQKKKKTLKKKNKKLELNKNTNVKVKKDSNLVATINVNGTGSSKKVNTPVKKDNVQKKNNEVKKNVNGKNVSVNKNTNLNNNQKKDLYKKQNLNKKSSDNVELPKLKEIKEETEVKVDKIPVKEEVKEEKKTEVTEQVQKEEKNEVTVNYVDATYEEDKEKKKKEEEKKVKESKEIKEEKRRLVENTQVLYNIFVSDYMKQQKKLGKKKVKRIYDYEAEDDFEEKEEKVRKPSKYRIVNIFFTIIDNLYLLFNAVIGVTFIFLMIGLIEVNNFSNNFIIYVGCLLGFLVLVAMSYNRYLSGRILTIILCAGMFFTIFKLQYNYDFLDGLDHRNYETKTYYVVTFDNNLTKKIYSLNNKKVGLLNDNKVNIERKLNIKVESINYLEFDDLQEMVDLFYNREMRAVIVTPNQYKYLSSAEDKYGRKVKVIYTFEAVGLK